MWKTGGPVFPLKRGLVAGRTSDHKNKNADICCGDPNREKSKEKEAELIASMFKTLLQTAIGHLRLSDLVVYKRGI